MEIKAEILKMKPVLHAIASDDAFLDRVHRANAWFLPGLVRQAIRAMDPWWDRLPPGAQTSTPKTIGIITAGNVPLVGLHDLVSVLLAGHRALLKLSSRDALLLPALLDRLSPALPVTITDQVSPAGIDFLLATGSDNTARYLRHDYQGIPRLIRKNRFSAAVLTGGESSADLDGLARDILLYHGMGCRSVSNLLIPQGMDLSDLWLALERFPGALLAEEWREVLRWEHAVAQMKNPMPLPVSVVLPEQRNALSPARVGVLHWVEYADEEDLRGQLRAAGDQLQCVVGQDREVGFGRSQMPEWDDFADGVDVMSILSGLD